jgi:hypothetical protein
MPIQYELHRLGESGLSLADALMQLKLDPLLAGDPEIRVAHSRGYAESQSRIRAALQRKAERGDPWASRELRLLDRQQGIEEPRPVRDAGDAWQPDVVASVDALFEFQRVLMDEDAADQDLRAARRKYQRACREQSASFEKWQERTGHR